MVVRWLSRVPASRSCQRKLGTDSGPLFVGAVRHQHLALARLRPACTKASCPSSIHTLVYGMAVPCNISNDCDAAQCPGLPTAVLPIPHESG